MPDQHQPVSLRDAEIDAIVKRLKSGQYLDEHLKAEVFAQSKEAELVYAGKQSRGAVLAETLAVPLQSMKRFGDEADWTNILVFGDNLQVLKTLLEMKEDGQLRNSDGSDGIRLCYIDPPFATKREFRTSKGEVAYRDKVAGAEFIEFLRRRLIFIHELLADNGTLYLHLDTNKVHYMKVLLDEIFGPQGFRNEIIWKRSDAHSDAGGQGSTHFGRIHEIILRYTKTQQTIFHPHYLPLPQSTEDKWYKFVDEDTGRRYNKADITGPGGAAKGNPRYEIFGITRYWRYSQQRMQELIDAGLVVQDKPGTVPYRKRYLDESRGVPLQDIWDDIPMLRARGGRGERTGYPTQKPVALVERIIETSTNEGDLVLDCFLGSGTTAVAAEKLCRRWVGVDCGKLAVYTAQRRLIELSEPKGKQATLDATAPFELCSAGLYDNALLEDLASENYEGYEAFCLELFGCRRAPKKIAAIPMIGTRKGSPVHMFPFHDNPALIMGRDYIESMHERMKGKVSGPVYVIVPVSACDPGLFEDVIALDDIAYFILRVPYSVIEALHGRRFELVSQPHSLDEVNDALDSFGFDFVQVPEIESRYSQDGRTLTVELKAFHRGGLDPDDVKDLADKGRGDLAMLLVDAEHDGQVFNLHEYRFGEELERAKWKAGFDLPAKAKQVMLSYMDLHGNERREVLSLPIKAPAKAKKKPKTAAPA